MPTAQKPGVDDTDVPTWLKPDQIDALLDAVHQASPDYLQLRDEALVTLAYDTGLRAQEVVGLDVDHLHLDDADPNVFVPAEIQKGGEKYARDTPIELRPSLGTARLLRHYLRDRWKDTTALFPSRSSPRITTDAFRNVMEKLAFEADVEPYRTEDNVQVGPEHVSPHSLRHSLFYREFVEDERRLKEVSLRLRHRRVSTTEEFYANLIRV
jgi:integrase